MNRTQAERLITAHVKPLFGFALKRCARIQDAEDVAQEIALRAYRALLTREDVADPVRYIWTVAHHVLANHYRDRSRACIGPINPDAAEADPLAVLLDMEATLRLQREIAFLSRQQREIIVAYYFHGQKQADIAEAMQLPLGTVKWHLFEAKKELKRNMEKTRELQHLAFDPIRFTGFGTEGSIGSEGSPWRMFRSTLHQNIAYAAWRRSCTIPEIAQATGVSPVYVEDAVTQMTEQGYLTEQDGKYRCAILLTEVTDELNELSNHMSREAARLIAPALAQALRNSDIWSDSGLYPGTYPSPDGLSPALKEPDFALWALIPWCISGSQTAKAISFDEVATLRPDGAHNLCHANITALGASQPALYAGMDGHFSGPCWNEYEGVTLWQIDTCWSERRIEEIYQHAVRANLALLRRLFSSEPLTAEEYACLAQKGLIHFKGHPDEQLTASLLPVWLAGKAIREKLLSIAGTVYAQHHDALEALKEPYARALLADTPPHLQKLRRYMLQHVYQSDWFIMHCLNELVEMNQLCLPAAEERAALHTIIITE